MFKYLFKLHNLYCRGSPASMDSWNYGDIMAYELREDIFQRSTAIVARNDATALKQYLDGKDAAVAVWPWAEDLALREVLELAVGVAAAAVVARVTAAGTVLRQASQPPVSPPAAGSQVCPVDTRTEWSRWYSTLPGTL